MMNRRYFIILVLILGLSLPFTYGGCVFVFSTNNIDREKDPDDDDTPSVITTQTSRAVITPANAKILSAGALGGGITRIKTQDAGLDQDSRSTQIGVFRPLRIPLVLQHSLQQVQMQTITTNPFKPAITTKRGTFQGDCGGRTLYSIDIIDKSRTINGNFSFEKYCVQGFTVSGKTDIDGTYGIESGDFTAANFSFSGLTDGYMILDGEISLDVLHMPMTATFSAHNQDIESGQTYWINDYAMNINEYSGYTEAEIFGTFHHPDHGAVTLTTSDPFIVHHEDDWPTSGTFEIWGSENTKAELNALDQWHYSVTADTDGDDVFDWDSGVLNWRAF